MSRNITFYPLTQKSHKNKQNINHQSPQKHHKPSLSVNRKTNHQLIPFNQCLQKDTVNKTVLGQNQQQFILKNNTSLSYIQSSKNSPLKEYTSIDSDNQDYMQNLKPMRDINTSLQEEIEQDNEQCTQCDAFHF